MAGRSIDVRRQKNLSAGRTFGLCVKGITHRLLRSLLTLAVMLLAVAFFMFLLSENAFVGAIGYGVGKEVADQRYAARTLNHLYTVPTIPVLSLRLSRGWQRGPAKLEEYARVSGWTAERVETLAETCSLEQEYLEFFDSIAVGKRAVLVQKLKGREVFRHLSAAEPRAAFVERIKPMLELELPREIAGFEKFLIGYAAFEKDIAELADVWRKALDGFNAASQELSKGDDDIESWLSDADSGQLENWRQLAVSRGFDLPAEKLTLLQKQLQSAKLRQGVVQKLSGSAAGEMWRKTFRERERISIDKKLLRLHDKRVLTILNAHTNVTKKASAADSDADTVPDDVAEVASPVASSGAEHIYTLDELASVSRQSAYEKRLATLESRLSGKVDIGQEEQGLGARQKFLLMISFVVCTVGIANAMLMSITERFREIATMKCLGATDRYILIQFMLEAALQGFAGGILGLIVGFIIAMVKSSVSYGAYVFLCWPGGQLGVAAVFSLLTGVLLAVLASVYPSWAASRMVPMEAMRVE